MNLRFSRKVLVIAAVAAQLLVLAWMAGEREWILRTGRVVYLRTAPVDPRDLFRGDFVRLQYEINSVRTQTAGAPASGTSTPAERERKRHEIVYTRLQPAGEGLFESAGASTQRPKEGLFIRGRTEDGWRFGWRGGNPLFVKYGIEQLFVEQGRGLQIEERRGRRDGLQVPMEVEVALSGSGTAVIRGYRWSRLGIKLEILRRAPPRVPNAPPPQGPLSPKVRLTLANTSEAPLAIVDYGDRCAFRLVAVEWMPDAPQPAVPQSCQDAKPMPSDVIALSPGQTHSVEFDLSEPRWHVVDGGKTVELGALQGLPPYRFEYRAPPPDALPPDAKDVWQGRLPSQAFNANGIFD